MALIRRHPPTVEPGATGVGRPSTFTIASPAGAPVSRTRSAKSCNRRPSALALRLASECWREITATTRTRRRRNSSAISMGTRLHPDEDATNAQSSGLMSKFLRMRAARPGTFSRNIAWRWPLAPTTRLWKLSDSSTMGLNPGNEPYLGHISSTRMRLWPDPNRWTMRPRRMVSANQRAVVRISGSWSSTRATRRRLHSRYWAAGVIVARGYEPACLRLNHESVPNPPARSTHDPKAGGRCSATR